MVDESLWVCYTSGNNERERFGMKNGTFFRLIFAFLAVALLICGCAVVNKPDPSLEVLDFSLVAENAEDLQELENYVNLQTLNLQGSDCYDAIESYIASHPQVKVTYDVEVAGKRYEPTIESLKLEDGSFDLAELLVVIKHLPKLVSLELPKTTLTADQIQNIADTYPNLDIFYTIELLGEVVASDLTELDLSGLTAAELDEALLDKLRLLPGLTKIQLMDAEGNTNYTPADVKNLMVVMPDVAMDYSFQLFSKTVTTADERVEFINEYIGNEGIPQIRAALDILPNCTYFLLDRCGISNEVMAQLRDDYPDTKVVWRVYWGPKYHDLTDVEMIRSIGGLKDDNVDALKYCTDVKYLDMGHSSGLHNFDFIYYMTKLKVAIVVDSYIYNLEPFANCTELEWLEIVGCVNIRSLAPLENCKNLKGLNMSCVHKITDLTPLFGLKNMERLYLGNHVVPGDMVQAAREALPNTWITDFACSSGNVSRNYAIGWRLDSPGVRSEWYQEIRKIFRLSEGYTNGMYGY